MWRQPEKQLIHLKLLYVGDPGSGVVTSVEQIASSWDGDKTGFRITDVHTGVQRGYFAGIPSRLGTREGNSFLFHFIAYEAAALNDLVARHISELDLANVDGIVVGVGADGEDPSAIFEAIRDGIGEAWRSLPVVVASAALDDEADSRHDSKQGSWIDADIRIVGWCDQGDDASHQSNIASV